MADRIAVMYGGQDRRARRSDAISSRSPLHPYTQGLMDCVPNILLDQKELNAMPGSPPDLVDELDGCPFAPRCPKVMDICRSEGTAASSTAGAHKRRLLALREDA